MDWLALLGMPNLDQGHAKGRFDELEGRPSLDWRLELRRHTEMAFT